MRGRKPDEVWINLYTACVVCPWHGEQGPEVEYQPGRAACGCVWTYEDGRLLAANPLGNTANVLADMATDTQKLAHSCETVG